MGLFNWFRKKNPKQLTEGERREKVEDTTVEIEESQENEGGVHSDKKQDENYKIRFQIETALREYDEWFQKFYHVQDEKYEGPISIYHANDGESIISLNYNNVDKKDSIVLAIAKIKTDGEDRKREYKRLTSSLDRMLSAIYGKRYSQIYDLKGYLNEMLDDIKSKYNIQFTNEGEAVLLNANRKFIYTNKTVLLKKDNGYVLGYERLDNDSEQEYNAFDIPDENSCYPGTITVTLPMEKCDLSKIRDEQKRIILDQLEELYKSSANIGIINGIQNDDMRYKIVELCKHMQESLKKTKYGEILKLINLEDLNNMQTNIQTIKKYAMNAVVETALYYEDLIEEYVNDPNKYASTDEQRKMFSRVLETAKTEYFYRRLNGEKTIEENKIDGNQPTNSFRESVKISLTNQQTSPSTQGEDRREQYSKSDEQQK